MKGRKWGYLFLIPVLLTASWVWAAKPAVVDVDELELMDGPGPRHQVIDKLKKGSSVMSSNLPIDGYFKIRTSGGRVGFVPGDSLVFTDGSTPGIEESGGAPLIKEGKEPRVQKKIEKEKETEPVVRFRAFGGGTLFSLDDLHDLFSKGDVVVDALKNGFHYGGEVNYILIPSLYVIIRTERMEKTVYLRDDTTRYMFDLTVSTLPVTTGLGFRLLKGPHLSLNLGLMGGLGFSTQLKSVAMSLTEPNETVYADTPFAGVARLDGIWHVTRLLGVYVEGGYRFLRSQTMPQPTTVGNGSEIFQVDGSYSQIQINLSGLFASAGLTVSF